MGLWDLVRDGSGLLELTTTGLEGSFAELVAGGTAPVDPWPPSATAFTAA